MDQGQPNPSKKAKLVDENKENARQRYGEPTGPITPSADFRAMLLGQTDTTMMEFAARESISSTGSDSIRSHSSHFEKEKLGKGKLTRDMRITEVLAHNFEHRVRIGDSRGSSIRKMEGDIPTLCLHPSFFVEGVRIGWPFPAIMPPQRQMAMHLVKALKNRRHVVLESPTGTGKSAAILCSVLAWQRYHHKLHSSRAEASEQTATPRIIYCSRTHSQVAQMVASLRKTPYRPKMAVLGSRERLCIHKKIQDRSSSSDPSESNAGNKKKGNVNKDCQARVRNTEEMRKRMHKAIKKDYDDENPPEFSERDNLDAPPPDADDQEEWTNSRQSNKPCCPHYRQLTSSRTANLTYEQFVPQAKQVNCCQTGGEKSKLGSFDIEDLVSFGMDPHVRRDIAIYRAPGQKAVGLTLASEKSEKISIHKVNPTGAAFAEGSLRENDTIVRMNGNDVTGKQVRDIAVEMAAMEDPVLFDVTQESEFLADETGYSTRSPCPYYLSRAIARHAELVFAPYNYVLDPFIRKSLDISLENTIVVLDEAHNVEDTLRESGSGKFGEFELMEILCMLSEFSSAERGKNNLVDIKGDDKEEEETKDISDLAHDLLLFVEKLLKHIMDSKLSFERNPGNSGANKALADWHKFHTSDDTEFDVSYDGPTGHGVRGKPVGCQTFFDKLDINHAQGQVLMRYGEGLDAHIRSKDSFERDKYSSSLDKMNELLVRFSYALEQPEHYFVASVVKANGNLEFAAGMSGGGLRNQRENPFQRKPKSVPLIPPRSSDRPNAPVSLCLHKECRQKNGAPIDEGGIRHGSYCNGVTPPWEAFLVLELLTPAPFMTQLADECHSVVLASGSLAPIASLCGELGLLSREKDSEKVNSQSEKPSSRLQINPPPLEANHVISLEKQLLACSIGFFPNGTPLTVNYQNYSKPEFIPKLGEAIAAVVEAIPSGGVLVFLPSYSFLRKCVKNWNPSGGGRGGWGNFQYNQDTVPLWDRLIQSKGKVIVEPTGSQAKFEAARDEYAETIRTTGSCILLAVFRGKMSEGISFNDANARGVICVGIPFPNAHDRAIKAKKQYNDEQRRLHKRHDLLPGGEWYAQQAYRAIAQALGRCIRHAGDYGTVVLMDSRFCDDGAPVEGICRAHRQLPKWMRHHVKNLSKRTMGDPYGKSIAGGWAGLRQEMSQFFLRAPIHAQAVLDEQAEKLRRSKNQAEEQNAHRFNRSTGEWTVNDAKIEPQSCPSSASAPVTPSQATPMAVLSNDAPTPTEVKSSR